MFSKEQIEKEISRELTVLGRGFSDLSYCELIERWQNAYKSVLNSHLELYAENEKLEKELAEYHKLAVDLDEQGDKAAGVIKTLEGINQKLYAENAELKADIDDLKIQLKAADD
jgi:hypothetical protein